MKIQIQQGPFASQLHGGEYAATGPNGPFPAWCAEQTQTLRLGEVIDYTMVDGIEAWGAPISQAIDRLMSWTVGAGWPTTLDQNDSIQSAIWSILSGGVAPAESMAAPVTQHASLLHNELRQDLLVSFSVGEPYPLPLFLLGVAMVAAGRLVRQ